MPAVYLFAFRGVGRSSASPFAAEPPLIKLGHVGITFQEHPSQIWGFRPRDEDADRFATPDALMVHLIANHALPGTLYDDYAIFAHAAQLDKVGARTEVRRLALDVDIQHKMTIETMVSQIVERRESFAYALPGAAPNTDNCVTFLKRLTVPVWETNGMVYEFMEALIRRGAVRWRPA